MPHYLYQGAVAPAAVVVRVVAGDALPDLSVVTGAELVLRSGRNGSEETVAATVSDQTADELLITYVCPDPTAFPSPDWIRVVPRLLTAGGSVSCAPRYLQIRRVG
jgi:hypothetical protein